MATPDDLPSTGAATSTGVPYLNGVGEDKKRYIRSSRRHSKKKGAWWLDKNSFDLASLFEELFVDTGAGAGVATSTGVPYLNGVGEKKKRYIRSSWRHSKKELPIDSGSGSATSAGVPYLHGAGEEKKRYIRSSRLHSKRKGAWWLDTNSFDLASLFEELPVESEFASVATTNKPDKNSFFDSAAAHIGMDGSLTSAESLCSKYGRVAAYILYGLYQRVKAGRCDNPEKTVKNYFEYGLLLWWCSLSSMTSASARQLFLKSVKVVDRNWYLTNSYLAQGSIVEPVANVQMQVLDPNMCSTSQGSLVKPVTNIQTQNKKLESKIDSATQVLTAIPETRTIPRESQTTVKAKDEVIEFGNLGSICIYDNWIKPTIHGKIPHPRYEHGCVTIQDKMYLFGGNYFGCYLNDLQVLDFTNLTWSKVRIGKATRSKESSTSVPVTPCTSHSLITWNNSILSVGGFTKAPCDTIAVTEFDINSYTWRNLETNGRAPISRGGQSRTLIGSILFIFGGWDDKRSSCNDLHMLELDTMTWISCDDIDSSPSPRAHHIAACHASQYLFIFGGHSKYIIFNDLYIFDTQKRTWSKPQQQGVIPSPRVRRAGVTIGDNWFIAGGWDPKKGVSETFMLNMRTLVWSVVTSVELSSPVASEGLSLCSVMYEGEEFLVAFGGRNRVVNNEISVLRPSYKQDIASLLPTQNASSDDESLPEARLDEWIKKIWGTVPHLLASNSDIGKGVEASFEPKKEPKIENRKKPCAAVLTLRSFSSAPALSPAELSARVSDFENRLKNLNRRPKSASSESVHVDLPSKEIAALTSSLESTSISSIPKSAKEIDTENGNGIPTPAGSRNDVKMQMS